LEDVVKVLNKELDAKIIINNNEIKGCLFSGNIEGIGLTEILELLEVTFELEINISENKVLISGSGEGC
ncbi:MAG: DUF4974 domain-containing protein, partial [Bacteroidetes bacterium]|nr:DUF4974 domain-containing protein [Bacteroidota bacterium]